MVIFKKKTKFIIKIKIFNFIMSCLFNSLSHHIPNLDSNTLACSACSLAKAAACTSGKCLLELLIPYCDWYYLCLDQIDISI